MRKYIAEKLDSMGSLEEKNLLREVLEQVFLPLYDETMKKYDALEQRVKDELPKSSTEYAIYSTMLPKNSASHFASWLTPILDVEDNMSERNSSAYEKNTILDTIYMEVDWLICQEIGKNNEKFTGSLLTENGAIPIEVVLKPSNRYLNKIADLYSHFMNNGIPWTTINLPYVHKMFDVVLAKDVPINSESLENKWEISFEKYDVYIKKDVIPVWNISEIVAESEGFPIPVIDKKSYEYYFSLEELGAENGYLLDYKNTPIIDSRREKNTLIVSVAEKQKEEWTIFKISRPVHMDTLRFPYPILTNQIEDQFADKMISYYGSKINTKAELVRVINSYMISNYIKFEDFKVINNQLLRDESYEANFFLKDEIRDSNISKTLILQFSKNGNRDVYLMRDVMSFVVSQVQLIYPEYNCVGALL